MNSRDYTHKMRQKAGFTIVELVVVVAVIGILAAISVVTYNGIVNRAYESKAVAIVKDYETALKVYRARHGNYPDYAGSGGGWVCLGTTSQYPARDGFAAGECEKYGSNSIRTDDNFMAALNTVMGHPVSGELPTVTYSGGKARGVMFINDEVHNDSSIDYYSKGSQGCPRGVKEITNGNTLCVVYIDGERNN